MVSFVLIQWLDWVLGMKSLFSKNNQGRQYVSNLLLLIVSAMLVIFGLQAAYASSYVLGPQDKLNIRVGEWRTSDGSVRDWSAINGVYSVSPGGTISLPFVGQMEAEGKTTDALASAIGSELQKRLGLLDLPAASVEVAEYRPFYITGDVEHPGPFPCAPGVTVLKAVALAGGYQRLSGDSANAVGDFINAKGQMDILSDERLRLLFDKARLKAETAGGSTFQVPDDLKDAPNAERLIAGEQAIIDAHRKGLDLQLKTLEQLKQLLSAEIDSLGKKSEVQQSQLDLAQKQIDRIDKLADKGLAINSQVLALRQQAADIESRMLDVDTATLTAKQDINKATQDENTLRNKYAEDLSQAMHDTDEALAAATLKMSMYRALMADAADRSGVSMAELSGRIEASHDFSIQRTVDGKSTTVAAGEDTAVLPGDVIKVRLKAFEPAHTTD